MSSKVSPPFPPVAANGLLNANESLICLFNVVSGNGFVAVTRSIWVKSLASTFALMPPPCKYLTVNVVWEGAIP